HRWYGLGRGGRSARSRRARRSRCACRGYRARRRAWVPPEVDGPRNRRHWVPGYPTDRGFLIVSTPKHLSAVIVHQAMVTSIQAGVEPPCYFPDASVDHTEARNRMPEELTDPAPEFDRPVRASRRQDLAVGAEGHVSHGVGLPGE